MEFTMFYIVFLYFVSNSVALEDYSYENGQKQMAEQGRSQYQLIKEKGTLPRYGACFKAAVAHINEGCRYLSEDTQSDIALHITNCFLEMSGHETYNCELDKKPNLRGICINSMSDRAFNVYTEFYTHTQNICWFLRGQVWQETIAENTFMVGKRLEVSMEQQQEFNRLQQKSMELQATMFEQGQFLANVLEDISNSTTAHQDLLKLVSQTVSSLQAWVVGEISWIDSILFNSFALFLIFIFTSCQRTMNARVLLFIFLFLNVLIERFICSFYIKYIETPETHTLYNNLNSFIWYSRYAFTFLSVITIFYCGFTYRDISKENLNALNVIRKQNQDILSTLRVDRRSKTPTVSSTIVDITENGSFGKDNVNCIFNPNYIESNKKDREQSAHKESFAMENFRAPNLRYELRSTRRQHTPDSGIYLQE